jgi:hypothetical protein
MEIWDVHKNKAHPGKQKKKLLHGSMHVVVKMA